MRKLIALSNERKFLLVEAVVCLIIARIVILFPFRYWSRYLGKLRAESEKVNNPAFIHKTKEIRWAVNTASRFVLWRADCLPQAVAARMMFWRRRMPYTLYLGVAQSRSGTRLSVEAHAWVRCGTIIVTGAAGRHRFKVVSTFAKDY